MYIGIYILYARREKIVNFLMSYTICLALLFYFVLVERFNENRYSDTYKKKTFRDTLQT